MRQYHLFPGRWVFLILWISFAISIAFPSSLPALTIQQEREIGEKVLEEVKRRWPLVDDFSVTAYINGIGKRVLQVMESQPFEYQFFVINTQELNAFAVPGGKVFVNTGLILAVDTEDELASVICHEIGHVVARHIAKQSEKGQVLSLATLGAVLAGLIVGGKTGAAVATTSVAASQTAMLKYSRDDEDEADYLGLRLLERAGYDRRAMLSMLRKMRRHTGPASSDPPAYLLTHPAIEERISDLEVQMARYAEPVEPRKPVGSLTRIQTKLNVGQKDIAGAVTFFQNWEKRRPEDAEGRFGLGLALRRMGAMDRAIENLSQAASLSPQDGEIERELGATYFLTGNMNEAQGHLEKARTLAPSDGLAHFYMGRVFLEKKMVDPALQALLRARDINPALPDLNYHLAQAYGAKNELGPAYLNLGYHYRNMGDSKNALANFQKALPLFPESSSERQILQKEIESLTPKKNKPSERKRP